MAEKSGRGTKSGQRELSGSPPRMMCTELMERGIIEPYSAQVAGHGSQDNPEKTFLKHRKGYLLKPLQPPPRGDRETRFYETLATSRHPVDKEFAKWTPNFYGVETLLSSDGRSRDRYLKLEDVTGALKVPNVMDVKIGRRTYGPDANEQKRLNEDSKYAGTKSPLGFSILGLIVHPISGEDNLDGGKNKVMRRIDKSFGHNLRTEEAEKVPEIFFDGFVCAELLELFVQKMEEILKLYESQTRYLTYASSILLAYDAEEVRSFRKKRLTKLRGESVSVRLIDFAHVFEAENGQKDENFIHGLTNLIELFRRPLLKLRSSSSRSS